MQARYGKWRRACGNRPAAAHGISLEVGREGNRQKRAPEPISKAQEHHWGALVAPTKILASFCGRYVTVSGRATHYVAALLKPDGAGGKA